MNLNEGRKENKPKLESLKTTDDCGNRALDPHKSYEMEEDATELKSFFRVVTCTAKMTLHKQDKIWHSQPTELKRA